MAELNENKTSRNILLAQIILFNLIPLIGVLFFHWNAALLILVYFLETMIAMLFHAVRLWYVNYRWGNHAETKIKATELAKLNNGQSMPASCLPIFMLVFFGFFCFVQLFVLGGFAEKAYPGGIFHNMYEAATEKVTWVLISFSFLQLSQFIMEVIREQYRYTPSEALLLQPFRRILVQQLTVILGGFFILFGGATTYVFILVLVNLGIDLFFFFINNKKLKAFMTKNDPAAEKNYEEMKKIL